MSDKDQHPNPSSSQGERLKSEIPLVPSFAKEESLQQANQKTDGNGPYPGQRPYREDEKAKFFGRDIDAEILIDKVLTNRLTLLFAASGVGKSSLLQAAVIPHLKSKTGENLAVVYHSDWVSDPVRGVGDAVLATMRSAELLPEGVGDDERGETLAELLTFCGMFVRPPLVLILDQLEEFFRYQRHQESFRPFINQLTAVITNKSIPVSLVISMREDFALELNAFKPKLPTILFENFYRLENEKGVFGLESSAINDICSAMELLFLSYKKNDVPYIYIINLLELLIQSARTIVCILRFPKNRDKKNYALDDVKENCVIFANFRNRKMYNTFCKELTEAFNNDLIQFFTCELEKIPSRRNDLYFCLPRIIVRTREVQLNHSFNREAYRRIRKLLQAMYLEKSYGSIDLLSELYDCLNNIQKNSNLNCPDSCNVKPIIPASQLLKNLHFEVKSKSRQSEQNLLELIDEWADYAYKYVSESRLVKVAHPGNPEELVDYSNVFFFLRVNKPNYDPEIKNCDSFDVKIIYPDEQRKELSLYYHKNQKARCQWYHEGHCRIQGMPECEFEEHWDQLPENSQHWRTEEIVESYAPFWEALDSTEGVSKETSEAAFRSNSVVFERYAKHPHPSDETGYVRIDPKAKRDRVMACIRYRLLPAPDEKKSEEDCVPQVMFVPIYTGGSPLVSVATVINANRPESLSKHLSEWRFSYRFAEMVFQSLSSRLKETARKAYLNIAADIMADFVDESYKTFQQEILETRFYEVSYKLEELAIVYPYPKISLVNLTTGVENLANDSDRRIILLRMNSYEILVTDNQYWCHYSEGKKFFTLEDIARKLESTLARKTLRAHHTRSLLAQLLQ